MSKRLNNNELKIFFYEKDLQENAGKLGKKLIQSKQYSKEKLLEIFKNLSENPENYLNDTIFGRIAAICQENQPKLEGNEAQIRNFNLREKPLDFAIFGAENIDANTLRQMETVMKLPVSLAGALMPDAHVGYGLPIGGVLATSPNAIIPYAVGVDIACRMSLSVWDISADFMTQRKPEFKKYLQENTHFGLEGKVSVTLEDEVWENKDWNATGFIRSLRTKAQTQIGSSGTGNHFVEWGILEILEVTEDLGNLPIGNYLALLSHSGSRGFGANIAEYYSKIATQTTGLPREAQHLAWLDMSSDAGSEYFLSMNLAGEYAKANHEQIHRKMAKTLGEKPILNIENHHNFAWKEFLADGSEAIVHRKGATPAAKGVLGIIPASMTDTGFVVRGKGAVLGLNSASHGAGRAMSRSKALQTFTMSELKKKLSNEGVTLIGGGIDEAPMVYKDIETVMKAQTDLVEILAKFTPKIVRMAEDK